MSFLRRDYDAQEHAENIGQNYDGLFRWVLGLVSVAVLLAVAYWYGYVLYPRFQVLDDPGPDVQPLQSEIPLDVMPVLPDSLAQEYDTLTANQLERISTFRQLEGGTVAIPIEDAIQVILEEDQLPTR
jgi:hypothetical protein